ncbi:MAG: UDP-3-O-acyl-N-acetylglucosamine deacetylase [Acidobacteria bacterium]|nr:UDP-3-O-acyl-N-acetylglucosamine deacetylase [Acidobacteriota bacterium]
MPLQTTISYTGEVSGVGLHTGAEVRAVLNPAPAFTGVVFRRTDLDGFEIPASPLHVAHVSYATALVSRGVMVATVEHLLAAIRGCGIDNVYVDIDGMEVPILDGSSKVFVDVLRRAGTAVLHAPRRHLRIKKKIEVADASKHIAIEPSDRYSLDCTIEFSHPLIGHQRVEVEISNGAFERELAAARTFGFLDWDEPLRKKGLIRGSSLENAIVLSAEGMINPEPLRFRDEFVRHKALDLFGDLALLGMPIKGHVTAFRAGHALHNALVSKLLRDPEAWAILED